MDWFWEIVRKLFRKSFRDSHSYWVRRYRLRGHSGAGSQGKSAAYKARFVNDLIARNQVTSVIDLGCGDGQNAALLLAPNYLGLDISDRALALAMDRCTGQGKQFAVVGTIDPAPVDLVLSMDVVYHLIEDDVFDRYLRHLARLALRYVVIYGTDCPRNRVAPHVFHRPVAERFIALNGGWRLRDRVPNNELYGADWPQHPHFMVFEKSAISADAAPVDTSRA